METWTTKDGTIMPVETIPLSHVINSLKMRLRQFAQLRAEINEQVEDFVDDFGFDGDMAIATGLCRQESELLDKYDADVTMFVEELRRRGHTVTDDGKIEINLLSGRYRGASTGGLR